MADEEDIPPRQDTEFTLTTVEKGKIIVQIYDRINVDDVFLHLVNQETYRVLARQDIEPEVNQLFKDYLLKERFTAAQN